MNGFNRNQTISNWLYRCRVNLLRRIWRLCIRKTTIKDAATFEASIKFLILAKTPSTNASITMNDSQVGMMLNLDMPFYGRTLSWGGFTSHIATHLPIVEKLSRNHPDHGQKSTLERAAPRPLSRIASFAGKLNEMITFAKKRWSDSAFMAADLASLLAGDDALKADFIRNDLRVLVDVAIKRVEDAKDLSPDIKQKLSLSLLQLSMNLLEMPSVKQDIVRSIGADAVLQSSQFFAMITRGSECIQFAPTIARDFTREIRDNPVTGNYRFHQYLEKLAEDARKKLGSIPAYSPALREDLILLIDNVVTSVKLARPLEGETTLRGLSRAQQRQQCR